MKASMMPLDYPAFYSQHGEDYLLWRFFQERETGTFVDVGAYDGIYLSNTYALERLGWRGVCVEPLPDAFEWCRKNRPESACYRVACVGDSARGPVTLHTEPLGVFSATELSGSPHDLGYIYHKLSLPFDGFEDLEVPSRPLGEILDEQNITKLDVLSVDTEGTELDVLRGVDLERVDVRVIILEANSPQKIADVQAFANRAGYQVARAVHINQFLVKSPEDAERLQAIRIRTVMVPQTHPRGPEYTFAEVRDWRVLDQEKDLRIEQLKAAVERRDRKVEALEARAEKLQARMREIHGSKSFRAGQVVASPYRMIKTLAKRVLR